MYDAYNRWVSKRPHIHFYMWERCADALGIDMLPIPAPEWLDRVIPDGVWRFGFDS